MFIVSCFFGLENVEWRAKEEGVTLDPSINRRYGKLLLFIQDPTPVNLAKAFATFAGVGSY